MKLRGRKEHKKNDVRDLICKYEQVAKLSISIVNLVFIESDFGHHLDFPQETLHQHFGEQFEE